MHTPKILIVDDAAEIHYLMELHLTDYAKTINQIPVFLHAEDGRAALDLLATNPDTDVVVLDLQMPVMNGFQFLTQTHDDRRFRLIPICVFSSSKEDSAKALALGASDYVYKPGDYEEIVLRVFNLIESKHLAETSERSKITFLSTVGHELRTPMNGVIGFTELLQSTELSDEQSEYVDGLEQSSNNMMTMISDVLSFLESEHPLYHLPVTPFALRATVQESIERVTSEAENNGVALTVDIPSELPDNLNGLPDKLQLIFYHLLSNGIKFSPSGMVTVSIEAGQMDDNTIQLLCSVTDTGIGIPKEKQSLIFEPFTQADGSSKRKFGGLGIGLSIASRILQMMGSTLTVESSPSNGSRFNFAVTCGIG